MKTSAGIRGWFAVTCGLVAALSVMPSCSGNSGPDDTIDADGTQDTGENTCTAELDSNDVVDFGFVRTGEKVERDVVLFNKSACPAVIREFHLEAWDSAHVGAFSISIDGEVFNLSADSDTIKFTVPMTIEASSGVVWKVSFSPVDGTPTKAFLLINSYETDYSDPAVAIELVANQDTPLMTIKPDMADFGGRLVGKTAGTIIEIQSTGTQPVEIYGISLDEGSSSDFQLDLAWVDSPPTQESPAVIPPGENFEFLVKFTPDAANPRDESNKPIPDTGVIHIDNNGIQPSADFLLSGYGVTVDCPVPIVVIEEGEEVPTGTTLHISGSDSAASSDWETIDLYSWSVDQPDENDKILLPATSSADVTHEVTVPGDYQYCLNVCDGLYCSSDPLCGGPMCKTVRVMAPTAIHCELTWNTPGDQDQFDEGENKGADLDLHFAHPFAATSLDLDKNGIPDPWFDELYDVWWLTKTQDWETPGGDPRDNPYLDRDDDDGAGPENVTLTAAGDGRVYSVGVHYFDDHGFGPSYPRIKCYLHGQLRFDYDMQAIGQPLYIGDMWYAAKISWPQQTIEFVRNPDNSLLITRDYPASF